MGAFNKLPAEAATTPSHQNLPRPELRQAVRTAGSLPAPKGRGACLLTSSRGRLALERPPWPARSSTCPYRVFVEQCSAVPLVSPPPLGARTVLSSTGPLGKGQKPGSPAWPRAPAHPETVGCWGTCWKSSRLVARKPQGATFVISHMLNIIINNG